MSEKQNADLIIHHAHIYTVDSASNIAEAIAIKDGKILEVNTSQEILQKYKANKTEDAKGHFIFPGFIDAHCHFVGYALGLNQVNLVGTKSYAEVLARTASFSKKNETPLDGRPAGLFDQSQGGWLIGRGWDQNDWDKKQYPTKEKLDSLFPTSPVLLTRIDGHAALANSVALNKAGITVKTKTSGGEILVSKNQLTGILIDNAVDLVRKYIPENNKASIIAALLTAQQNCLAQGLTTLDDAGLMKADIDLLDELQKSGRLKLRIYAMLSDSAPNYAHYLEKGPYKTDRLNVRAFKFYADGALGSRGACLHEEYTDKKKWKGFLLSDIAHFKKHAHLLAKKGFQMNTHCIGDSAMSVLLGIYENYCNKKTKLRWRIEHAQVLVKKDFEKFKGGIIPSVQPTHATSDMYWVKERLGHERTQYAYAYKALLKEAETIALGTDFPVEDISPFKTFYAATARQDSKGFPKNGFQKENALTREEALKGMTIWAAYANFEEQEKGSLEKGKMADFVVLDKNIMTCELSEILKTTVQATYINGEKVFTLRKKK